MVGWQLPGREPALVSYLRTEVHENLGAAEGIAELVEATALMLRHRGGPRDVARPLPG